MHCKSCARISNSLQQKRPCLSDTLVCSVVLAAKRHLKLPLLNDEIFHCLNRINHAGISFLSVVRTNTNLKQVYRNSCNILNLNSVWCQILKGKKKPAFNVTNFLHFSLLLMMTQKSYTVYLKSWEGIFVSNKDKHLSVSSEASTANCSGDKVVCIYKAVINPYLVAGYTWRKR